MLNVFGCAMLVVRVSQRIRGAVSYTPRPGFYGMVEICLTLNRNPDHVTRAAWEISSNMQKRRVFMRTVNHVDYSV